MAEFAAWPRNHGDRPVMPNTPFAIALVVASTFAALAAAPCRAVESDQAYKAGKKANAASSRRSDARDAPKSQAARMARRNDKEAPRRIVTYNLFEDPVFKLNGALADKRQLLAPPAFDRLGQTHVIQPLAPRPSGQPAATALKLQEPESTGIDFGCGDKPFRTGATTRAAATPRELTACYKHNVDRSWKTQTYLSREYTEGSQKWGGGLAVRYAY